jgi:hypothetical protein
LGAAKFNDDQSAKLRLGNKRIFDAGGVAVRVDGNRSLGGGEQSTALNQFFSADSIGEKAEVANADQAGAARGSGKGE